MSKRFYVDLPDPYGHGEIVPMINVGTFDTREEAVKFLQDNFGADENGMINPISEMEEEEDDE